MLTADVLDSAVPAMDRMAMLFKIPHDRMWDALLITGRTMEDRILILVVDDYLSVCR